MSQFYNETMQGLLEAIAIEKGGLSLKERENMSAKTFYVRESDEELVNKMTELRK